MANCILRSPRPLNANTCEPLLNTMRLVVLQGGNWSSQIFVKIHRFLYKLNLKYFKNTIDLEQPHWLFREINKVTSNLKCYMTFIFHKILSSEFSKHEQMATYRYVIFIIGCRWGKVYSSKTQWKYTWTSKKQYLKVQLRHLKWALNVHYNQGLS